ncbi:MAG: hypothetical protein D6698_06815 [Gammaproteobacteria bacterium]|nr:MAG: hypothetical protein D6698_06815 [Gammaproteobacteria bacterium]
MLRDPTGGQPDLQDPFVSLPVIAVDIGLSLFGRSLVRGLTRMGARYPLKSMEGSFLRGTYSKLGYLQAAHLHRVPKDIFHQIDLSRMELAGVMKKPIIGGYTRPYSSMRQEYRGLRKTYLNPMKSAGATLAGIARATAYAGIISWGLQLGMEMAAPGVRNETIRKDREQVLGDQVLIDTRAAFTQRQRALQAIHDSQLSVNRAILGQEARYVHR